MKLKGRLGGQPRRWTAVAASTMRLSRIGAKALLVSVVFVFVLSVPALATTPQDVTITALLTPGNSGPWSATGAIQDSGSYLRADVDLTGSIFRSPTVGSAQDTVTFTGSSGGTFTIQNQVLFTLNQAGGCCDITGQWVVDGGTGVYADLLGQGSFAVSGTYVILQGQVHFDGP